MTKVKEKIKKHKISKKTYISIGIICVIIIGLVIYFTMYMNSQRYEKRKMENTITNWAKEYYEKELTQIAAGYIKNQTENDKEITINIDALKKYGKNTNEIKNSRNGKTCDDIETYVAIKVDKDAKNISKDYKIARVVLDCFD